VIDGGNPNGFRVPKSSLRRVSSVLGRKFDNEWSIEGQTNTEHVLKEDTVVWTIFLYWLLVPEADLYKEMTYGSGTYGIKCIVFADKYDIKPFHDMAMAALCASSCIFPIRLVEEIFHNTHHKNLARQFIVQRIVHAKDFDILRMSKWTGLDGTVSTQTFFGSWPKYLTELQPLAKKPSTKIYSSTVSMASRSIRRNAPRASWVCRLILSVDAFTLTDAEHLFESGAQQQRTNCLGMRTCLLPSVSRDEIEGPYLFMNFVLNITRELCGIVTAHLFSISRAVSAGWRNDGTA
jgi:hypothetical protein